MRYPTLLPIVLPIVLMCSCTKAGKEVAEELGIVPSTCGSDGARVQVEVDGSSFCADAHISAIADGTSAMVTGVGILGSTFSIQLDTLGVGTHTISEASNAVMYANAGTPFVSVGDEAGTVTIEQYDPATGRLKAHFHATVFNEMNGNSKSLNGAVDVTCTHSE
ncbi:MAG: hypothetical protein H6590_01460 [Flavobacteriales bacterium]|nr:hypothetical protein [Flavobacteriales bacterium]HPF89170.1 hypothetical protein [Flavobacteriales bacterium]